jgi:hypothetical protein
MARASTAVLKRRIQGGIKQFKTAQELRWFRDTIEHNDYYPFSAAQFGLIQRYGKPFLGKFKPVTLESNHQWFKAEVASMRYESPVGIVLSELDGPNPLYRVNLDYVKLGFERGAVCIEAVQGERRRVKSLKHFEKIVGMPWPNFIIKKIEATARRLGYKQVRFRGVESLAYYKSPDIPFDDIREYRSRHPDETKGLEDGEIFDIIGQQIRTRMKTLYTKLYTTLGYQKREGDYWVKDL